MVAGKSFKDYYEGGPGGCGVKFKGDYHDPIRVLYQCERHLR